MENIQMVLFHGTNAIFEKFKVSNGELGRGVYLTTCSEWAREFGDRVLEVHATISRPWCIFGPYGGEIDANGRPVDPSKVPDGCDAIIHRQSDYAPSEVLVLDPQIVTIVGMR